MLKNPFRGLDRFEMSLWLTSVAAVVISFIMSGSGDALTVIASLIGVTALIFVAKGYVIGQILTIAFAVFYGIISVYFGYYGEAITYLGMTAPVAFMAVVSWLKHPYKGTREVEVNRVSRKENITMWILAAAVTAIFYFILSALGNKNIVFSTISVTTSFVASYSTYLRSPYYGLGYAANDIVLIVLWVMACIDDISYLPMVVCFVMFLANDLYGFCNWSRMKRRQSKRDTVRFDKGSIRLIAHRGACGLERENTLPAFREAAARSYYGIETDVRVTRDGKFALLHNASLEHVTEGRCTLVVEENDISLLRRAAISDLDGKADRTDMYIPTLAEYVSICKEHGKVCVIEIKGKLKREELERAVAEIRDAEYLDGALFISFDLSACIILRELFEGTVQYLVDEITEEVLEICKKYRFDIDARRTAVTKEWVDKFHGAGLLVNVWTVNTLEEANALKAMGVDYITTDILE